MGDVIAGLPNQQYFPGMTNAPANAAMRNALAQGAGYGYTGQGRNTQQRQQQAGNRGSVAFGTGLRNLDNMRQQDWASTYGLNQDIFNQIYNNPAIQGMKDASTRDLTRQLNWSTLPGINEAAGASTGGAASGLTKKGQANALAEGMTMDRMADVNSQIDMNAFNQAVQGGLRGGAQMQDFGQGLSQQYGQYGQVGMPYHQMAYDTGLNSIQSRLNSGLATRGLWQEGIDAQMARHNFNQTQPWNDAANRLNLINMGAIGTPQNVGMDPFTGVVQGMQTGAMLGGLPWGDLFGGQTSNAGGPPPSSPLGKAQADGFFVDWPTN